MERSSELRAGGQPVKDALVVGPDQPLRQEGMPLAEILRTRTPSGTTRTSSRGRGCLVQVLRRTSRRTDSTCQASQAVLRPLEPERSRVPRPSRHLGGSSHSGTPISTTARTPAPRTHSPRTPFVSAARAAHEEQTVRRSGGHTLKRADGRSTEQPALAGSTPDTPSGSVGGSAPGDLTVTCCLVPSDRACGPTSPGRGRSSSPHARPMLADSRDEPPTTVADIPVMLDREGLGRSAVTLRQ